MKEIRDDHTIPQVNGFLFASTTQQPRPTVCFNILTVSELAEQSTTARPVKKVKEPKVRRVKQQNNRNK